MSDLFTNFCNLSKLHSLSTVDSAASYCFNLKEEMLTIIVSDGDGGITIDKHNQFSFTGRVEGEDKLLISLHNAIVSDENVHTVHGHFTINSDNTVIGGCKINSFCIMENTQ